MRVLPWVKTVPPPDTGFRMMGMMKMLPNMTVITPCDYNQTKVSHAGP